MAIEFKRIIGMAYISIGETEMAKIFISYRRRDDSGRAEQIYAGLISADFKPADVFLDAGSIDAGADWNREIRQHLDESRVVLAVIGINWLADGRLQRDDDYVRLEIATALTAPSKIIIPVLVDGAEMPDPFDLPDDLKGLTSRQGRWLSHRSPNSFNHDLTQLVKHVRQYFLARIIVKHKTQLPLLGSEPIQILVNDQMLSVLRHNQEETYEFIAGDYTLIAKVKEKIYVIVGLNTPSLNILLEPGEERHIYTGTRMNEFLMTVLFLEER
jgi:hypothetical protein